MEDVRVLFEFTGVRKTPTHSGYRADHDIDGYLTCGQHKYEEAEVAPLCGKTHGTISFIMPAAYPHTLFPGKVIPIQEGSRVIGYATVEKVLNPLLNAEG